MESSYSYQSNYQYAALPPPDYLSAGNAQYQNQYQQQQQQAPSFPTSPYNDTYQQFVPPPVPSYGNSPGVSQPHNSEGIPMYQPTQYLIPQPSYSSQTFPPPPSSPQLYSNHASPQPPYQVQANSSQPSMPQPYSILTSLQPGAMTVLPGMQPPNNNPTLPDSSLAPTATSAPQCIHPTTESHGKVKFDLKFVHEDKGHMRNKYRHVYTWKLSPGYTLIFDANSSISPNHASLTVERNDHQVGHVNFFKSSGWNYAHIVFPFISWPAAWDPDTEQWYSDAGTMDGASMEWETLEDKARQEVIFRCISTGQNADGDSNGQTKGVELCRTTVNLEKNGALVELDENIFGRGRCKVEQVDEMLTIAMVLVTRLSNGWRTEQVQAGGGGGGSHASTLKNGLKLANASLELASGIMQAAGGGG